VANTNDYEHCFGFTDQSALGLHIVEQAAEAGGVYFVNNPNGAKPYSSIPSCAAFDAVAPGATVTFSDIDLAARAMGGHCSLPVADVTLPSGETITTARKRDADVAYVYRSGASYLGVTSVMPAGDVAGCRGQWILSTFPNGVVAKYPDVRADAWGTEYLFDALAPGDDAPVVAMRYFVLEEGTSCAALPPGVTECADVFSGYYEQVP
jgi:hypothetical protein